jgi:hypothetical protein
MRLASRSNIYMWNDLVLYNLSCASFTTYTIHTMKSKSPHEDQGTISSWTADADSEKLGTGNPQDNALRQYLLTSSKLFEGVSPESSILSEPQESGLTDCDPPAEEPQATKTSESDAHSVSSSAQDGEIEFVRCRCMGPHDENGEHLPGATGEPELTEKD